MLTELAGSHKIIGLKQTKKALHAGVVRRVYLSADADIRLREAVGALCAERQVDVVSVESMEELGRACGIQVGAAVAAVLVVWLVFPGASPRN